MLAYCAREAGLARKELGSIQEVTQTHIANNREVSVANMQMESGRQIEDVQAVSGETYPDFTRIASTGSLSIYELTHSPRHKSTSIRRYFLRTYRGRAHVNMKFYELFLVKMNPSPRSSFNLGFRTYADLQIFN